MSKNNVIKGGNKKMKQIKLFESTHLDDELEHQIQLHIKAMMMVAEKYGNTLSHEEFMDKAEELFCELFEEENHNGIAKC